MRPRKVQTKVEPQVHVVRHAPVAFWNGATPAVHLIGKSAERMVFDKQCCVYLKPSRSSLVEHGGKVVMSRVVYTDKLRNDRPPHLLCRFQGPRRLVVSDQYIDVTHGSVTKGREQHTDKSGSLQ